MSGFPVRASAFVLALVFAFAAVTARAFAEARYALHGEVRAADGAPVARASVELVAADGTVVAIVSSGTDGSFTFAYVALRRYTIVVSAAGYRTERVPGVEPSESPSLVHVIISPLADTPPIGEIVHVTARTSDPGGTIVTLAPSVLAANATGRTSDALNRLPGVDISGDAGSPGGDAYVSLRGLRPSESANLLDGHPVGPLGVGPSSPDSDGVIEGYNLQDAPYFALRDLQVEFGAGPAGAWGLDSTGGSIDARTLDPTRTTNVVLDLGGGTQGRQFLSLQATGTSGRFGYALVHGVEGTFGSFPGGSIAQTGLRGTDFTSATLASLTYPVSGDYVLRNELAKIAYRPDALTRIVLSAYDANSWADKTGEGDNDANPYAYTLFNAPVASAPGCSTGVLITTDTGPACVPPSTYAREASGPAGGGPGAWQSFRNQDYTVSAERTVGAQRFSFDAFTDNYAFVYHRAASDASGALDESLDLWRTDGVRLADVASSRWNVMRFGATLLRQTLTGDQTSPDGSALVRGAPAVRVDRVLSFEDTYAPNARLALSLAANGSKTSIDPSAHLATRFTAHYDLTPRDAIRFTAGSAPAEPSLQLDRITLLPAGALNPDCGAIRQATPSAPASVNVGSAPSQNLATEKATDLELGYGRRVGTAATFGVTAYDTNMTDRIVTGSLAAGSALPGSAVPAFLNRIAQFCGATPPPGDVQFALTRAFNAGSARARGVAFAGRVRVSSVVSIDATYDIQSVVLDGIPNAALASDPTLVDGAQVFAVPLHKAGLGVEASFRPGLDARVDAHYVGVNNPQQLPGYAFVDASLTQRVSKNVALALVLSNVFDSHASSYGEVGLGIAYPTNPLNAGLTSPFVQPFDERYGLAPASLSLGLTLEL